MCPDDDKLLLNTFKRLLPPPLLPPDPEPMPLLFMPPPPLVMESFMENMLDEELLLAPPPPPPMESREKVPMGGKELLAPVIGRLVVEFWPKPRLELLPRPLPPKYMSLLLGRYSEMSNTDSEAEEKTSLMVR